MTASFCPCCGYNLQAETPVEDGPYRYQAGHGFHVNGARLKVRPQVHDLLGSIMTAKGRMVSIATLCERIGYERERPTNLLNVYMTHARRALFDLGLPLPVENVHGRGYMWNREAPVSPYARYRVAAA